MGLFDKLEKRLESGVNSAFAKAFRAEVQPVELASAMRRAMDDRATSAGKNKRPIVPNMFDIELSSTDHEHLTAYQAALVDELKASAAEHAETQRYTPGGPLTVNFTENDALETGVFKVRPSIARQAVQQPDPEPLHEAPTDAPEPEPSRKPAGGFALPGMRRRKHDPEFDDRSAAVTHRAGGAHDTYTGRSHEDADDRDVDSNDRAQDAHGWEEEEDEFGHAFVRRNQSDHQDQYEQPAEYYEEQPERPAPWTPSPAAPRSYRQRPYLDIDGDRYPLMGAITIIGRDDDVDIVLDDSGVSRRHSEVRVTNDGPHLVASLSDLGSTNGTFLNGERVTSVHLDEGDRITVGRTSIIFRQGKRR
ncbi:type III secretion system (T3SS) inner membrane Yop/YscD-like protein [Yimella lutea]|uniref:Type III secretion system (T3SS) inner membrane Yop/YscD-like protein n=1 Tax=Yimella lutea TaxID=587872 RepID=A0A542ECJ2_9MICO|nr:DUF3662 and FHA domain-containing protein [Yimella lutea]TQJ13051.1 type III secretion system (T3SS) inner membrane Yop/YscD-like protein [Yimella lutea]